MSFSLFHNPVVSCHRPLDDDPARAGTKMISKYRYKIAILIITKIIKIIEAMLSVYVFVSFLQL